MLEALSQWLIVISFCSGAVIVLWRAFRTWRGKKAAQQFVQQLNRVVEDFDGSAMSAGQALEQVMRLRRLNRKNLIQQATAGMSRHERLLAEAHFFISESRHKDICDCLQKSDGLAVIRKEER